MPKAGDTQVIVELTHHTLHALRAVDGTVEAGGECVLENKAGVEAILTAVAPEWKENGLKGHAFIWPDAAGWHFSTDTEAMLDRSPESLGAIGAAALGEPGASFAYAACNAGDGGAIAPDGMGRWVLAYSASGPLERVAEALANLKVDSEGTGPAAFAHISAIAAAQRLSDAGSVALWDLGTSRSTLILVSAEGVEAVAPCTIGLEAIYEAVQSALKLKFRGAGERLFFNETYDFTEPGPKVGLLLGAALKEALQKLPKQATPPALACLGLAGKQAWFVKEVAAAAGLPAWAPDMATLTGDFNIRFASDEVSGAFSASSAGLFELLHSLGREGASWAPAWEEAEAPQEMAPPEPEPEPEPEPAAEPEAVEEPEPAAPPPAAPVRLRPSLGATAGGTPPPVSTRPPRPPAKPAPIPVVPQVPGPSFPPSPPAPSSPRVSLSTGGSRAAPPPPPSAPASAAPPAPPSFSRTAPPMPPADFPTPLPAFPAHAPSATSPSFPAPGGSKLPPPPAFSAPAPSSPSSASSPAFPTPGGSKLPPPPAFSAPPPEPGAPSFPTPGLEVPPPPGNAPPAPGARRAEQAAPGAPASPLGKISLPIGAAASKGASQGMAPPPPVTSVPFTAKGKAGARERPSKDSDGGGGGSRMGLYIGIGVAIAVAFAAVMFVLNAHNERIKAQERERQEAEERHHAEEQLKEAQEIAAAEAKRQHDDMEAQLAAAKKQAEEDARKALLAEQAVERESTQPGTLVLATSPSGAAVSIDGGAPLTSPVRLEGFSPGAHHLRISLYGRETIDMTATIKGSKTTDLGTLTLESVFGTLSVASTPDNLPFAIRPANDPTGTPVKTGTTPVSFADIPHGNYLVSFSRPECHDHVEKATVMKGGYAAVSTAYQDGSLELSSDPSGAWVTTDGARLGTTPLSLHDLTPKKAVYQLTLPGYDPTPVTVEIPEGDTLKVNAQLLRKDRVFEPAEVKTPPQATDAPQPTLSAEQRRDGGDVVLSLVVGRDGTVRNVDIVSASDDDIARRCKTAVEQWRYRAATAPDDRTVDARIQVSFKFSPAR